MQAPPEGAHTARIGSAYASAPQPLHPHLQNTLEFHYGKHHTAYVNNLNAQVGLAVGCSCRDRHTVVPPQVLHLQGWSFRNAGKAQLLQARGCQRLAGVTDWLVK